MIKNINRILRDKRMLILNPLINDNIYVIHDEENVQISRACIIGPKDTPYENGFYFFEFLFPDNYPFEPFKVQFFTNDGRTRMHPNFYSCGKVCVSIIGTWNGPGWTSCQTLTSVLLTLQSLLIKNPLHQEPGYENDNTERNKNYNRIIQHQNIKISIIQMIEKIPKGFEQFKPLLMTYLQLKQKDIVKVCEDKCSEDGCKILSPSIWNFGVKLEYKKLKSKIVNMTKNYKLEYLDTNLEKSIIEKLDDNIDCKTANELISEMELGKDIQTILLILLMKRRINIRDGKITKISN